MGTWGTSVGSSDEFCDVYEEFFSLYNQGYEMKEIKEILLENYEDLLEIEEVSNEFWFALAKAQWECKALEQSVYDKVKEIIDTEKDLLAWSQLEACEEDIKKRKKALNNFLKKISKEKEVAKSRKKIKEKPAIFNKGDCIVFNMNNGNFGGAVVLDVAYGEGAWLIYIAKTKINKKEKPVINDFKVAEILVVPVSYFECEEEEIRAYYPSDLKNGMELLEVIGNVSVKKFRFQQPCISRFASYKELIEVTQAYTRYFEQGNETKKRVFLSKYIREE